MALGGPAHKAAGSGGRGVRVPPPALGAALCAEARPASPQFTSSNESLFISVCESIGTVPYQSLCSCEQQLLTTAPQAPVDRSR